MSESLRGPWVPTPRRGWRVALALCAGALLGASCATFDRVFPPVEGRHFDPTPVATRCEAVVRSGHRLPSGRSNEPIVPSPRPVKGVAFADPAYGNCVLRVTDHADEPPVGYARTDYSRRQAFNANATRLIVSARDGHWHLYDAVNLAWLQQLPYLAGDAEPQWHPTDPERLYYLPRFGIGMRLLELNIRTGRSRTVADFGERLRRAWPSAFNAWTKGEGSPSADGRYWCFMVDDQRWGGVGVFTWDRDTDAILGLMQTNGVRPDHVSMSPSGKYCVVSTDAKGVGTRAWTADFQHSVPLHHRSEHSDLALDANNRDVYVSIDYQSADGDLFMVDLETGKRTMLLRTYLEGTATALHVSGRGFGEPGWVVLSTYAAGSNSGALQPQWLHGKVFAVGLTENPVIRTLAHHQGLDKGYLSEPHATVSRDFSRILFNSNWGSEAEVDIDAYLISLPPGALR